MRKTKNDRKKTSSRSRKPVRTGGKDDPYKVVKKGASFKGSRKGPARRAKDQDSSEEPKPSVKGAAVTKGFRELWSYLFTSPIHLDSSLSKQAVQIKSILAQIVPAILLRPASLAEAVGVGVPGGEPWSLTKKDLENWRPAFLIADRLYQMMVQGTPRVDAIAEDFPPAMVAEWKSEWGKDVLAQLVEVLGREAPLSLRASRRVGAQPLLQGLNSGAKLPVRSELSHLSPLGVRLSGYAPVLGTELFEKGAFEIQDEGSQFMSFFALWPERYGALLQKAPGQVRSLELPPPPLPKDPPAWVVVDACAGAGGKSLAMADALKGKGRVYAYDTSVTKLQALRRRSTRAGLNNIQAVPVKEGSESEVVRRFKSSAQVVLVDAPCSGWGVLRRNPDIKWRQTSEILDRMPEIQIRLLSEYSNLVAVGGRLTYGVCTFRKAETVEIVRQFLESHPHFKAQEGGYLGPGPCDGFFMQSFLKVEEPRQK